MNAPLFVGIDTSNYTTSVAVCDGEGKVLLNSRRLLSVGTAERGLRQSEAVFAHIKNLPELLRGLKAFLQGREVTAVGVSCRPRDAADSYMPCFLSGVAVAEAFSAGADIPLYRFSHQQGHIRAALETSGALCHIGNSDFLSFHVSGGTTELLCVHQTEGGMEVTLLGGTADLNAGQAIDRTGVLMGMQFPCGPAMEQAALRYDGKVTKPKLSVNGLECHLSGLENLAANLWRKTGSPEAVSAFVFTYIAETLAALTRNAREACGPLPVIYAGGVMSNSLIKSRLAGEGNVFFTVPEFSADNAAGIALLCRNRWRQDVHE